MKKNIMAVALLLVFSVSFAAIKNSGKRYDMSFVDADFQSVFHSISELAGTDILLAPDVDRKSVV